MKKYFFAYFFALNILGVVHANTDNPPDSVWLSYIFIAYYVVLVLYTGSKWVRWATALPAGPAKSKGLFEAVSWTVACIIPVALLYVIHGYLAMLAQQL